jgi:hypothetical protein
MVANPQRIEIVKEVPPVPVHIFLKLGLISRKGIKIVQKNGIKGNFDV